MRVRWLFRCDRRTQLCICGWVFHCVTFIYEKSGQITNPIADWFESSTHLSNAENSVWMRADKRKLNCMCLLVVSHSVWAFECWSFTFVTDPQSNTKIIERLLCPFFFGNEKDKEWQFWYWKESKTSAVIEIQYGKKKFALPS